MKTFRDSCRLFVVVFFLFSCSHTTNTNSITQNDTVSANEGLRDFYNSINLSSDEEYKRILLQQDNLPTRVSPSIIREFVTTVKPQRMALVSSAKYKNQKLELSWFCSEFHVKGYSDSVIMVVDKLLLNEKFVTKESEVNNFGTIRHYYTKEDEKMKYLFWFQGPERYIGSTKPKCSGSFLYKVRYKINMKIPSVSQMLNVYPELQCKELPESIYTFFKNKNFIYIGYGGSWHKYYDWSVSLPYTSTEAAIEEMKTLCNLVTTLGFELQEDSQDDKIYKKPNDNSYSIIYISLLEKRVLNFRFQPYL